MNQFVGADTTFVAGGSYSTNQTWTAVGSPYVIQGSITLKNAILTVQPGVLVLFNGAGIQVGTRYGCGNTTCDGWGDIQAIGTPDSQIVFTSYSGQRDGWHGLYFMYTNDINGHTSRLEHCILENAGLDGYGQRANLYCDGSYQPILNNCIIRNSYNGIYLNNSSIQMDSTQFFDDTVAVYYYNSSPRIHSGVFENNRHGVHLRYESFPNLQDNQYINNDYGISVNAGDITECTGTWHNDNGVDYA